LRFLLALLVLGVCFGLVGELAATPAEPFSVVMER
jgi:hypothetical protein